MAKLAWDKTGERVYQSGIDRGVLYLNDGRAFPWNGLTSVEDGSEKEISSYYMDGVKYLEKISPGDFSGKVKAFTYPDEFEPMNGVETVSPGLLFYDQPPEDFCLSYRTKIGNDVSDTEFGYKIHLLYNLVVNPDASTFETLADPIKPVEFTWSISGSPPPLAGHRPTVHIAIDSTSFDPEFLQTLEEILYGTDTTNPRLPSIQEIADFVKSYGVLIIVDNGDGTWTAIDQSNEYITMTDPTTFRIDNADAVYLDVSTYQISTTNPE